MTRSSATHARSGWRASSQSGGTRATDQAKPSLGEVRLFAGSRSNRHLSPDLYYATSRNLEKVACVAGRRGEANKQLVLP
jgi:hypothetical protein